MRFAIVVVAAALSLTPCMSGAAPAPAARPRMPASFIPLPGGAGGIGFDDLRYSPSMKQLLVPAGRTGRLDLVDPVSGRVVPISGFSVVKAFNGGHDDGVTSVADGAGLLFVTDRTSEELSIVDPATRSIVAHTALSAGPDYVRWLDATHELWVTEPDSERIEIFHLETEGAPHLTFVTRVQVPGGPESLTLDSARGRAYTHIGEGKTAAIDLRTHAITAMFAHGCEEAKGVAIDAERGLLFVACEEGSLHSLDVDSGREVGRIEVGGGIDIIGYSPELAHVYVPSSETAKLAIIGVSKHGALELLGTFPGTKDSHCVAAAGKVFMADPPRGRLRILADPFPASGR